MILKLNIVIDSENDGYETMDTIQMPMFVRSSRIDYVIPVKSNLCQACICGKMFKIAMDGMKLTTLLGDQIIERY